MASVIDCFVAKGQRRACKDGEEGGGWLWDARGWLRCHGGQVPAVGSTEHQADMGSLAWVALEPTGHRSPLCLSFSTSSSGGEAAAVRCRQRPGLRWGLQGDRCRREEVGEVGAGGGLCVSVGWAGNGLSSPQWGLGGWC